MQKFKVFQIQLTDAEVDHVNANGHDSLPKHRIRIDMDMDFSGTQVAKLAREAMSNGYYTHVSNITAEDVAQVFEVGNIGPESQIERLGRMSSVSVGNVVEEPNGTQWVCAAFGWKEL